MPRRSGNVSRNRPDGANPATNLDEIAASDSNSMNSHYPVEGISYLYIWTFESMRRVLRVTFLVSIVIIMLALAIAGLWFALTRISPLLTSVGAAGGLAVALAKSLRRRVKLPQAGKRDDEAL
jgi:ABC-type sugar transport system permease subunit